VTNGCGMLQSRISHLFVGEKLDVIGSELFRKHYRIPLGHRRSQRHLSQLQPGITVCTVTGAVNADTTRS
jgi:hypothetical protein